MGQTLTHGIYLPDEGERNCYNGLAANWSILDGAVGTIAEHTSALSGKAPLVHTHSKADITDFPVYGTTAGTICEGNDSRLSDARTPVAHTHVTADVTDLLNTTHEWTKEQVCNEGFTAKSTTIERCVTPDTVKHINFIFKDKNNKGFGAIRRYFRNTGDQQIQIFGNTKIKDGQYDETGSDVFFGFSEVLKPDGTMYFSFDGYLNNSIRPRLTNTYQLGDSSYQWQSVYAQSYYYNGTAWGLDKANEWTGENTFSAANLFRKRAFTLGDNSSQIVRMEYKDTNNSRWGVLSFIQDTDNTVHCDIGVHALKTDGQTVLNKSVTLLVKPNNSSEFKPINDKAIDLGTSTNKWKSLNGINPGALSIFNPSATQDPIDVPNTWVTDGSAWNTLNVSNMGDGWICLAYRPCGTNDYILARFGGTNAITYPSMIFPATMLPDSKYYLYVLMPVAKAMGNIYLEINLDSNAVLVKHSFIPAYGTV